MHVSGNANITGNLAYGTLTQNSPILWLQSSPEPMCLKNVKGVYTGCVIDENFEWKCKIDDRCNKKYLDAKLEEEIQELQKNIPSTTPQPSPENLPTEQNLTNSAPESTQTRRLENATNSSSSSNTITGNAVNELGLETDLTNILEPESNETTASDTTTTAPIAPAPADSLNDSVPILPDNNGTLTLDNNSAPSPAEIEEVQAQSSTEIVNENIDEEIENEKIKLKIEKLSRIRNEVKENKITVKQAKEQLKLEQLKHIDLDEIESEEDAEYATRPAKEKDKQITAVAQLDYMTKVNGSIILRLG